jgi:hypothetical protein
MPTISQYLNELEERDYLDSRTIEKLSDTLRAWQKMCSDYYYNPTRSHAETIIREINDWEMD